MTKTAKKENGKSKERKWRRGRDLPGRHYVDEKHRTPIYEKAVSALIALREENPGLLAPAYAEASTGYIEHIYSIKYDLNLTSGRNVFEHLIGKHTYANVFRRWMDHPSLWLKDGRPYTFVGQPYGLTFEDLKDILHYCEEYDLTASVDAGLSWWYPGWTVLVEVKRKE